MAKLDLSEFKTLPVTEKSKLDLSSFKLTPPERFTQPKQTLGGSISKYGSDVMSQYEKAGTDIVSGIKTGADQIQQGKPIEGALRSGLRAVGGVAEAAFAPITEIPVVKSTLGAIGGAVSKIPGFSTATQKLTELAQRHPESAKDFKNIFDILTLGAGASGEKAATTAIEKSIPVIEKGVEKYGGKLTESAQKFGTKLSEKSSQKEISQIAEGTAPVAKKEEIDIARGRTGIGEGGIKYNLGSGVTIAQDTPRDLARANAVKGIYKSSANPVENIGNINKGIETTSKNELSPFFKANPIQSNFEDFRKYMDLNLKPDASLKRDVSAFKTYNNVKENVLSDVYNYLKSKSVKTGEFAGKTNMEDFLNARKILDDTINKELGTKTFGTPQYTGVKAAAKDARNTLNKYIEDSVSTGDIEKLNKATDFLNESRTRGLEFTKETDAISALEKQFGVTRDEAKSAFFKDRLRQQTLMYDARDNLVDQVKSLIDKGGMEAFKKFNPKLYKSLKYSTGAFIGYEAKNFLGF